MVDFSIEFDQDTDIKEYIGQISVNMNKSAYLDCKVFTYKNMAFFHIKPLMFPLFYFTPIIWLMGSLIVGSINKWIILGGLIPGISYLFYNKYWYVLALYIGKYKGKYKGKIKLL